MVFFDKSKKFRMLADELAHICPPDKEIAVKEAELIKGGGQSAEAVVAYLLECGKGQVSEGWWDNAVGVVRLIRKIPGADHFKLLSALAQYKSNLAEYDRWVAATAQDELYQLPSAGSAPASIVPPADARALLDRIQNIYNQAEKLEKLLALRSSAEKWSDIDKAFYYFLHGTPAEILYPKSTAHLAFFAAQVFYDPRTSSAGWMYLCKSISGLVPSQDTAAQLHQKYPLPATLEEIENYSV
jgi:hypothetical protein